MTNFICDTCHQDSKDNVEKGLSVENEDYVDAIYKDYSKTSDKVNDNLIIELKAFYWTGSIPVGHAMFSPFKIFALC